MFCSSFIDLLYGILDFTSTTKFLPSTNTSWINKDMTTTNKKAPTDKWLQKHGGNSATPAEDLELLHAAKLARATMGDYGTLIQFHQAQVLTSFLRAISGNKSREQITQGHCYQVMNIAIVAQRKAAARKAKLLKTRR
jgi:hypothetical protein